MTRARVRLALLVIVAVGAIAAGARWFGAVPTQALTGHDSAIPTARVVRGSLELSLRTVGELRASTVKGLTAPAVGGMLRLVKIADTGTQVHAGDVVMEFDPTEQQYTREQSLSQLAEADQEIAKIKADGETQVAQDEVALLTARFDVRRAELMAISNPAILPANEVEKRKLSLDEARRKLEQVQADVQLRAATSRASLAVSEAKRSRAKMAADRAEHAIDSLIVTAPIDGYVVVRDNRDASGGIFFSGMTLPSYRAGDNVFAGRPILDVFDISNLEIRGKVNEQERNNVAPGQTATVESDSLPGETLTATVSAVSGMVQSGGMFGGSGGPLREFDVTLTLDHSTDRLRPGTSVHLLIAGTKVDDVLHVPRQAVFEKNGKSVVYLRVGNRFEIRPVTLKYRNETRVALEGLEAGAEVALINPDQVPVSSAAGTKSGATAPGGPK
jgi:multidrug resistance efflux pump